MLRENINKIVDDFLTPPQDPPPHQAPASGVDTLDPATYNLTIMGVVCNEYMAIEMEQTWANYVTSPSRSLTSSTAGWMFEFKVCQIFIWG